MKMWDRGEKYECWLCKDVCQNIMHAMIHLTCESTIVQGGVLWKIPLVNIKCKCVLKCVMCIR